MYFIDSLNSQPKMNIDSDAFFENSVIYEPEYFLNTNTKTNNSQQDQQYKLSNNQILEETNFLIANENSSILKHEFQQNESNQLLCPIKIQPNLNIVKSVFSDEHYQNDNSMYLFNTTSYAQCLDYKFYEQKYDACSLSNLEQQSTQYISSLNEIEQQQVQQENEPKKFKNQNILKDIFNSFHKYVKDLKQFPVCELQNVDLKDIKKKFNRFVKIHSFNNSLIKYVLTHKFYKILFTEYFEKGHIDSWISKSRVTNKDGLHYWANYLAECTKNPSHLENLIINPIQKNKKKSN